MSEVYRYDLSLPTNAKNFGMRLSENGCWVEHESYAALESELAALRASIAALAAGWAAMAKNHDHLMRITDSSVIMAEHRTAAHMFREHATELRQLAEGNSAEAQEGL